MTGRRGLVRRGSRGEWVGGCGEHGRERACYAQRGPYIALASEEILLGWRGGGFLRSCVGVYTISLHISLVCFSIKTSLQNTKVLSSILPCTSRMGKQSRQFLSNRVSRSQSSRAVPAATSTARARLFCPSTSTAQRHKRTRGTFDVARETDPDVCHHGLREPSRHGRRPARRLARRLRARRHHVPLRRSQRREEAR